MESLAIVSLIGLLVAIVLGFLRNANVGIISIGIAFLIGIIYDISASEIISGFNTSLFITMLGVTYLFSIVNQNETLPLLAKKIVKKVGNRKWLLPIVLYIMGFVMSFIGPGAIPALAIMPIVAVPIALQAGYNPIMLSIIAISGAQSARMSPITPEGILVSDLLVSQGIGDFTLPLFLTMFLAALVNAFVAFIIYRGWKTRETIEVEERDISRFTVYQIISLIGLLTMMISVIVFKLNVGLVSFFIGTIIILIGGAKEKESINGVPWNVLLLVVGVGMLMEIVLSSGGIDILVNLLSSFMTGRTASAIMVTIAGVMSFFSSGLGVVFPTLIPTVTGITENVGGMSNAIELASMVVIGGTVPGFSPISTAGALMMAAISSNKEASELYPSNKLFTELFGWAFILLFVSIVISILGIYNFISINF